MKRNALAVAVLVVSFALSGTAAAATSQGTAAEVEAVIKQYLHYFDTYNFAGMESLTTPEVVVVDYGQRMYRADWNWFSRLREKDRLAKEKAGTLDQIDPIVTWDFDTKIVDTVAYSDFKQAWKSSKDMVEVSIMVLRRIDGKWLIDRWNIHAGEAWHKWLRNRIREKGGWDKVEDDWYEIYKQEQAPKVYQGDKK